jgi:hypothetical protein
MNNNYTFCFFFLKNRVAGALTGKYRKFLIAFLLMLSSSGYLPAQTQLEMSVGSYPTPPSGSTVAPQVSTLLENTTGTTFVAFSPAITYTLSLSNQQYTAVTGITTGTGLSFGTTLNASAKTAVAASVVNTLGAIGTGIDANHTSNPNGAAGTGIAVATNYGVRIFATVEPLYAASSPLNGRYYYGDLTVTFNRPVSDPVIHVVGLGGVFTSGTTQGFTMEYEMQTAGYTLSKLSGSANLNVTVDNKILNAAAGAVTATCGTGAACGSVKVTGTNITQLVFRLYVRGDGLGPAWSGLTTFSGEASTFSVSMNKPVTVSGTVFGDANGTTDNIINGTGTNAGGTLNANLVDVNGKVVATTAVTAGGTYSFPAIGAGNYTVSLSTTVGVQGATAPSAALPASYINTAEGTSAAGDGTTNGSTAVSVAFANVTGVNFGVNQLPTANDNTILSQTNPGGTNQVVIISTNFSGTDPDAGGQISFYKFTGFPTNATSITINGVNYTSGSFPGAGVTIAASGGALPAGMVSIDPVDGLVTSAIPYKTIDLAGLETTAPATVSIQFTTLLPVNFIDFSAEKKSGGVILAWVTSNEVSNLRFDVEKSNDARLWQLVGSVAAVASGNGTNKYEMTDNEPFEKNTYYRVKQLDKDGRFAYSPVLKINRLVVKGEAGIKIMPNPVTNTAIVEMENEQEGLTRIHIIDNKGVTVQSYNWNQVKGLNKYAVTGVGQLKTGVYYLVVNKESGEQIALSRLIKQ